jgi:REP element-mobilizing transposase RayT
MSLGLNRHHKTGDLHFITFSCIRKRNILGSTEARGRFVEIFEQTRQKYLFDVHGYVVMPNHVHILISEPEVSPLFLSHPGSQATLLSHTHRRRRLGTPLLRLQRLHRAKAHRKAPLHPPQSRHEGPRRRARRMAVEQLPGPRHRRTPSRPHHHLIDVSQKPPEPQSGCPILSQSYRDRVGYSRW